MASPELVEGNPVLSVLLTYSEFACPERLVVDSAEVIRSERSRTKAGISLSVPIGNKIKLLRNKLALTQDELARKADLPYTTLTKIESNVITKLTIQTVMKIASGLGNTIDDLMK